MAVLISTGAGCSWFKQGQQEQDQQAVVPSTNKQASEQVVTEPESVEENNNVNTYNGPSPLVTFEYPKGYLVRDYSDSDYYGKVYDQVLRLSVVEDTESMYPRNFELLVYYESPETISDYIRNLDSDTSPVLSEESVKYGDTEYKKLHMLTGLGIEVDWYVYGDDKQTFVWHIDSDTPEEERELLLSTTQFIE
ncbi:MAG: hypothetical protein ABIG66_05540 [Candidatus Kerfeldbacteria bacterium]